MNQLTFRIFRVPLQMEVELVRGCIKVQPLILSILLNGGS